MLTEPLFWAAIIFFAVPVSLCAYTAWLIWSVASDMPEHLTPMGDGSETPTTLRNARRANWWRAQ